MATIREIAAASGVSPSAVSRILNNDPGLSVSEETRRRVTSVALSMGYTRRKSADKATFRMGILQWFSAEQEIADDYYLQIRKGIEDFCIKNLISIVRAYRTDNNFYEILSGVDALICIGKFSFEDVARIKAGHSNTVFLDMDVKTGGINCINVDMRKAATDALTYLTELGHTEIAYIGGVEYASGSEVIADSRSEAYREFMKRNNLFRQELFREGEFTTPSGYVMMNSLLDSGAQFTAVLCGSDAIAIGAMKAIKDRGMKIPRDVSVMGINNTEMSSYTSPALTTMNAPAYDMGQHGANLAYANRNLNISTPIKGKVSCVLVERESCRRLER